MILSFHPIFPADENIICAGRTPDRQDLKAIRRADAVILPQGCPGALFRMAWAYCRHVFPNYEARFDYPGKIGQIRLFKKNDMSYPPTEVFSSLKRFEASPPDMPFPWVVKLNWGGEGYTVYKVNDTDTLKTLVDRIRAYERTGQWGFLVQQYFHSDHRSLRVAVMGRHIKSYWRVQPHPDRFGTAIADGAVIDHDAAPELQAAGREATWRFSERTGLQLAGLDFLFDASRGTAADPLLIEINYFFGRKGLGGSERYYRVLTREIDAWLARRGLQRNPIPEEPL
jgi:ribosomal protein S6--L-glutamate ligase